MAENEKSTADQLRKETDEKMGVRKEPEAEPDPESEEETAVLGEPTTEPVPDEETVVLGEPVTVPDTAPVRINVAEEQDLTYNRDDFPVIGFNFDLIVEGTNHVPCRSIGPFEKKNEYEYIQEGGLNDYVHMKRKPISAPFTFEVERYVGLNEDDDPLPNGGELTLPLILLVRRGNGISYTVRTYVFTGCVVMGKKYGELNAEKSALLTERSTIGYRELIVVDTPDNSWPSMWAFDGLTKEGNGKRSARHLDDTIEENKQTRESKARRWDPSDDTTRSAVDVATYLGQRARMYAEPKEE